MATENPTPSPANMPRRSPVATPESRFRRGEIWMVVADPQTPAVGNELWSNRPAIVVSNNVLNSNSGVAQIVYVTTASRKRSGPTHVEIPAPDGNGGTAFALCEQIHTVDASRLQRKMTILEPEYFRELDAAIALSLSLRRNPDTYSLFNKWEEQVKVHGIDIAAEISALAGHTADQRVEALSRALTLVAAERDAFQALYEAGRHRGAALDEVSAALEAHTSH